MLRKISCLTISLLLVIALIISGCGGVDTVKERGESEGISVVTSTSIIADIAKNVVGYRGTVDYIVPIGENPEDYNLLPSQFQRATDADIVFINGMALELMIENVLSNVTDTRMVHVSDGITPIPLVGEDSPDPHCWLDVQIAVVYAENILAALIEIDPEGAEEYRQNAQEYISQLYELDAWIREEVQKIPEKNRVIIVSENALKYFGEAYGFRTEGIWEINAHEEGTPQQISRIIDLVVNQQIPALFVESTVDHRYMNTIARETGVAIAGELFTDALGTQGSGGETYIKMMRHNVEIFLKGLK